MDQHKCTFSVFVKLVLIKVFYVFKNKGRMKQNMLQKSSATSVRFYFFDNYVSKEKNAQHDGS